VSSQYNFVVRKVDMGDELAREGVNQMIEEISKDLDWSYSENCTRGEWWVVFESGKPAAFAGMVPMAEYFSGAYLCASGVLPQYRGNGLQKVLIRKRLQRAKTLGCKVAYTDTIHENAFSANSLIASGFKRFVPSIPWGKTKDVHFWRKDLIAVKTKGDS
jgi:GNAT superfamily N-acetyltransferase